MKTKSLFASVFFFAFSLSLLAQQGVLDLSFGTNGIVKQSFDQTFGYFDEAQSIATLPDGKIMAAGKHDGWMLFARFEEDGDLDLSFGDSGAIFIKYAFLASDHIHGLIAQPDGKILALMQSFRYDSDTQDDWSYAYVMRFNPDGEFDDTFGTTTTYAPMGVAKVKTDYEVTTVNSFQLLPDGNILVTGSVRHSFSSGSKTYVANLQANGKIDTSFGTNGFAFPDWNDVQNNIGLLTLQSDNKILLSGSAWISHDTVVHAIARLNPDGSIDNSFGINGRVAGILPSKNYYVQKLFVLEDGHLLAWINGSLFPPQSLDVIRLSPNGIIDTAFGTNGVQHIPNDKINRIVSIMRDEVEGSFLLAGERNDTTYYNHPDIALAKLSPDFTWVEEFGNSGVVFKYDKSTYDRVKSATILSDGRVILAGSASSIHYAADMVLAKYFGRDSLVSKDTLILPPDSLIQNKEDLIISPNPVNKDFFICYELNEKSIVTIDLYNTAGQLIHTFLQKDVQDAGEYCKQFHWPDDIEKGVYFIKLYGRKFAYTGKILKL